MSDTPNEQSFPGALPPVPYTPWFDVAAAKQRIALESAARGTRDTTTPESYTPGKVLKQDSKNISKQPSNGETDSLSISFTIPTTTDPETGETVQMMALAEADLTVEDWGSASVDGKRIINLTSEVSQPDSLGGHGVWGDKKTELCGPGGTHTISAEARNITMEGQAYNNLFVFKCTLKARVLEPGGEKDICENACTCQEGSPDGGTSSATRSAGSTSGVFTSSAAASGVVAQVKDDKMAWQCAMGTLRGLGTSFGGRLQLTAKELTPALAQPASLVFSHKADAYLEIPEGGVVPGALLNIHHGSRVIALRYYFSEEDTGSTVVPQDSGTGSDESSGEETDTTTNETTIFPIGVDTHGGGRASLNADSSILTWRNADGTGWEFSTTTGERLTYLAPNGVRVEGVDGLLDVLRNAETGEIQQVWSYWDGLAQIENVTANSYELAFYTAASVAGQSENGAYLLNEGATAFKRFVFTYLPAVTEAALPAMRVTEQSPNLPDNVTTWTQGTDKAWSMMRGSGEDAIATQRIRTVLNPGDYGNQNYDVWQIVTEHRKGNTVCSRTAEVYQSAPVGDLLLTKVEGYGSNTTLTTQYTYDGSGNLISTKTLENNVRREMAYDSWGRLIREIGPWGPGGEYRRIVSTTYAFAGDNEFNSEPEEVVETIDTPNGICCYKLIEYYTYTTTEDGKIRRVERERHGCQGGSARYSFTETYTGKETNIYARGRVRMEQAENGVQTWHEYAATTEYGALYTETIETRFNGAAVNRHSTRTIRYINASGNLVRKEEWVMLYNGTWAKISGETYTYDVQNRLINTLKDNGRSSSTTYTCKGLPLRKVDEDGIQTDYAYDDARQLIEVSRAAVMDGDTCITPETITEYTRDALGRVLITKVHVGAMVTQTSSTYDMLGRKTSETDALGRTTTYSYQYAECDCSDDCECERNFITTVTRPNGATLITHSYASGRVAEELGSGQRSLKYSYEIVDDHIRIRTLLADGETIVSEQHFNGFDDVYMEMRAVPNGFVRTLSSYNAQGQLIQTQQDDCTEANALAPILYSYDEFGNVVQETLALADEPDATNSRIRFYVYSMMQREDGVYSVLTTGHNNSAGVGYTSSTATLISELSATLERKSIVTDPRGKDSMSWTERGAGAIRTQNQQIPTSNITATARVVDGFVVSQTDTMGISTCQSRCYTATGMTLVQTDGRGNATTTVSDIAGRTVSVTDAINATTTATYEATSDNPACITNALGKTICYRYDLRGRKVAEWGTAIRPASFEYDDADRLISLTSFRADEGDISIDPTGRTDGDTTRWNYHPASSLELNKTYADNSTISKTYDSFGRLATEISARGLVKSLSYLSATGELSGIEFTNDAAPAQTFAYTLTGKLASVTDAAGTRTFTYNEYDELVTDSLTVGSETHFISENRDEFGRSAGFAYSEADGAAGSEQYGYGADGRLATAAFSHNGESKQFGFSYLTGSNLMQTLTMPNGMTLTQLYETQRNLLTGMEYKRGETSVVERYYTYDLLGRPLTRQENRQGNSRDDSFAHNDRSELTAGILGPKGYYYSYDNIGNRKTANEDAAEATIYEANALNQYTAEGSFEPTFDADGNQTRVQTSTGIWEVTYNAENRPTVFSRNNEDGTQTRVSCVYDYMGRRAAKKVESLSVPDAETGECTVTTVLHQRYIYRGYLQIAGFDFTESGHSFSWFIAWDPTQPDTSRPLAIRKDGTWYCYGWDLTKNVCEVFSNGGYINNTVIYSYTPYGAVAVEGSVTQPIQWSSEYNDVELGLVYYNYRHYNPSDGKWLSRDFVDQEANPYLAAENSLIMMNDALGLTCVSVQDPSMRRFKDNKNAGPVLISYDFGVNKKTDYCCVTCPDGKAGVEINSEISLFVSGMIEVASYSFFINKKLPTSLFTASLTGRFWAGLRAYGSVTSELFASVTLSTCSNASVDVGGGFRIVGSVGFEGGFDAFIKATVAPNVAVLSYIAKKSVTFGFGASLGGRIELDWRPGMSCSMFGCTLKGPIDFNLVGTARLRFAFANTEMSLTEKLATVPNMELFVPLTFVIPPSLKIG